VDFYFALVENSTLSQWIRGSESMLAFPAIITLHALGLGVLAGGNAALDLRLLGVASGVPLKGMARFLPLLWGALAINAVTGTLLLIAYPTKALTNPVFYLKLALIAAAAWTMLRIGGALRDESETKPGARALALASLVLWAAIILAGRLLGYTHKWELLGVPAVL